VSVILVIQPDTAQGRVLHDVSRRIGAELVVVDSTRRAVDAIGRQVPDLILLSAFISPRDEDTLIGRLRSLEGASHLQTMTIPQFQTAESAKASKKSGFGFRKKQKATVAVGADPVAFADEVVAMLSRASEIRNRPPQPELVRNVIAPDPDPEPVVPLIDDEPLFVNSLVGDDAAEVEEPTSWSAAPTPSASIADEIDQLVRQLGLDVKLAEVDETPAVTPVISQEPDEDPFDFGASLDRARNIALTRPDENATRHADADAIRESALAEARAQAEREAREAREASAAEIARVHAEAEALRIASEARAASDRKVREALAADLARAQSEAEQQRQAAIAEARAAAEREAEQKRQAAIAEARAAAEREAEQKREAAIAEARAAAEREAEQKRQAAVAEARAAAEREAEQKRQAAIAEARAAAEREAEQRREKAIAEARAAAEREAREALAADLARLQIEAEQMRQKAMDDARSAAEREARETLEAEVARVRSEAHSTFTDALNKVKVEAEESDRRRAEAERISAEAQQAFSRELLRVRTEVEQSLTTQLDAARAEAERMGAAEAQAVRDRAAVETQLKAELERLKFVTAQARKADESETKKAAKQIKHLEAELATVRAKAEERKVNDLEELRVQMAEMREAAAQHARAAAAEAVAAAVAAAAPRTTAVIAQFPAREMTRPEVAEVEEETDGRDSRDYLSLWQSKGAAPVEADEDQEDEDEEESVVSAVNVRRHAKWALPVAACLILVTNIDTGNAISTVAEFVKTEENPALTVEPLKEEAPFIEVIERRVGKLQLDSTPSGAEAMIDGKSYGRTPLTIPDLDAGLHTLVLKGDSGTITRKVTIKANQTTLVSEAIYSGWLAIFSPIPVKVVVDGKAVSLTEDGRVMAVPGSHVVEFINEQFNYRVTEKLDVRPGETTPYTVNLPMGTVRVTAPEGAAILVDGQAPAGSPGEGLSLAIGSHEISATHPVFGERRMPVDVKRGGLTEVTLRFE
jgi:hypothetical protein